MLLNYLKIFFISMVPLIELRGAMPVSQFLKMPVIPSYIVCIIGNMIPVPFIYLFARKVLEWGKDKPLIGGFCRFCLEKGHKGGRKLTEKAGRGTFVALLLFVGIPLPGTGRQYPGYGFQIHRAGRDAGRPAGRRHHDDGRVHRILLYLNITKGHKNAFHCLCKAQVVKGIFCQ